MTLASYHSKRGKTQEAADFLAEVVASDAYNEEAQYQLIGAYIEGGQPFVALQQLRRYARLCADELGIALPRRFENCHRKILALIPKIA